MSTEKLQETIATSTECLNFQYQMFPKKVRDNIIRRVLGLKPADIEVLTDALQNKRTTMFWRGDIHVLHDALKTNGATCKILNHSIDGYTVELNYDVVEEGLCESSQAGLCAGPTM
jgi:hypothetical protein